METKEHRRIQKCASCILLKLVALRALKGHDVIAQGNALGLWAYYMREALKGRDYLVFSTKNRQPWIDLGIEESLFKYVSGICREIGCPAHKIGAFDDHIHVACSLGRTISISKLVEDVKTGSSKWMKTNGDRFADFGWQNGYGAFSIGQSQLDDLTRYVGNQREHHRRVSFQDEFRELLKRYAVEYDELYIWD